MYINASLLDNTLFDDLHTNAKSYATKGFVTVFCGSRTGNDELYVQQAYQLGQLLAKNGFGLVYGGASIGVMGAVADGVVDNGGASIGVIPNFLLDKEIAHNRLSCLYTTDTMHTRKAIMAHLADVFIVLAGGLGTLEEMMEIATWRQLNRHDKPIILVNNNGFYNHLIAHLTHTTNAGFMNDSDLAYIQVCQSVQDVLVRLNSIDIK